MGIETNQFAQPRQMCPRIAERIMHDVSAGYALSGWEVRECPGDCPGLRRESATLFGRRLPALFDRMICGSQHAIEEPPKSDSLQAS